MRKRIIDKFTDLPISDSRKWQLRHPEKFKVIYDRYRQSEKCKETLRRYRQSEHYKKWVGSKEFKVKKRKRNNEWRERNREYDIERKRQARIKEKL